MMTETEVFLRGKKVLVTGASGGIGAKIAEMLLAEGADVILSGRDKQKLQRIAGKYIANGRAIVIPGDINSPEIQDELVRVAAQDGRFQAFVSNAGEVAFKELQDTSGELLQHLFKTNCFTPIELIRRLTPLLLNGGSFVLMGSLITEVGFEYLPAYAATKSAMDGFMRSAAVELAKKGITINSVAPGPTNTAMWAEAPDKLKAAVAARAIPRLIATPNALLSPESAAKEVIHLLKMREVTGSVRPVDSGYRVAP